MLLLHKYKVCCLLPVVCLLLSSCGFHAVYSKESTTAGQSVLRAGIQIAANAAGRASSENNITIDDSAGKFLVRQFTNKLEDVVGASDAPTYKLEVQLAQSISGVGVARDGTATRYNLSIASNYRLIRLSDNKVVDRGAISNVTSYNNPNNKYFSTYVSEQDARSHGINEIVEIYRQRLLAFSEKLYPPTPSLSTPPVVDETCPKVC